jgi:polyvinyl alcohol dehydrogenase (cytochrome)
LTTPIPGPLPTTSRARLAAALLGLALAAGLPAAAFAAGAAPAAAKDKDDDAWLPGQKPPGESTDTGRGAQIFGSVCANCHLGQAPRAPVRFILGTMPPAAVVRALTTGAMREVGATLSAEDKVAVAEYVTNRKIDTHPWQPPACAQAGAAAFDWNEPPLFTGWGLSPANARHVDPAVGGLTAANVGRLKLKWAFPFDGGVKARSQPAIVGGALVLGSDGGAVYALDRKTGCVRWTFMGSGEVRTGVVASPFAKGDRSATPLVYFGDVVGTVYAVNATDGTLVWKAHPDEHPSATLTAAPVLHDGKLFVPVSSLEEGAADGKYDCCTFRGSIVAYDAKDGRELWRTYMTDPPKEVGKYPNGRTHYAPSGIALWNTPAVDAKRGLLYFGTGDNYSAPHTAMSDAIVAMELATGKIRWVNQVTPGDAWHAGCAMPDKSTCLTPDAPDYDFGASVVLATTKDGRDVVVSGQKSGWVYAMNRDDGTLLWKTRVGRGGIMAGVYFGMSVHDGRVFVPISDPPDGKTYDIPAQPGLYALDLDTGKFVWKAPIADSACEGRGAACSPGIAAPPTTSGDLVVTGGSDGRVRIQSATTGKVLWQYDTVRDFDTVGHGKARGGSIGGGAAPLPIGGTLIVQSGYGFAGRMPGNALLVFDVDAAPAPPTKRHHRAAR